jgi:hypothetical protein
MQSKVHSNRLHRKFHRRRRMIGVAIAVVSLCAPLGSSAAAVYAYPKGGQSAQQQRKDQLACESWAKSQTGFEPSRQVVAVAPQYSSPPPQSGALVFGKGDYNEGGGILDAGKGAGLGAIFGAIAGNAGAGAAIGAASGLFLGGVRRSSDAVEREAWERRQAEEHRQQQQAESARWAAQQREYESAFATCMRARNYQVN